MESMESQRVGHDFHFQLTSKKSEIIILSVIYKYCIFYAIELILHK